MEEGSGDGGGGDRANRRARRSFLKRKLPDSPEASVANKLLKNAKVGVLKSSFRIFEYFLSSLYIFRFFSLPHKKFIFLIHS